MPLQKEIPTRLVPHAKLKPSFEHLTFEDPTWGKRNWKQSPEKFAKKKTLAEILAGLGGRPVGTMEKHRNNNPLLMVL